MDEQFTPREDINCERTRKSKEPSSESIRTLKYYFINLNILTVLKTCSDRNFQGKEGRRENTVKDREKEKQKKREEAGREEKGVIKKGARDFPGDAVIKTLCSQCGGQGDFFFFFFLRLRPRICIGSSLEGNGNSSTQGCCPMGKKENRTIGRLKRHSRPSIICPKLPLQPYLL